MENRLLKSSCALPSYKRWICLAAMLCAVIGLHAQNGTISGTVLSETDNEPLPGVTVRIKGTDRGTVTDFDGNYSIPVTGNSDILIFSYIGFRSQEIPADGREVIDVVMQEDLALLDEVVVVGYGTQKKSDLTGSIAIVDADEAKKTSGSDISSLLQGRSSGVTVTNDGHPGSAPNIRIRGIGTFGDNQPLYIVDGVPVGTSVRDFNPNDIASVQVLKDASAGAIYGSRAANGVVIITTKNGRKNSPLAIEYNGYYGIDNVVQKIPVLKRSDYQLITNEKRVNAGLPLIPGNDPDSPLFVADTDNDWQKTGLKEGMRMNHNFNFSGGGEHITYNASVDYFENKGMFVGKGPAYERYSGRINTTVEKGRFRISPSLYYTHSFENLLTFRGDVLTGGRPPLINDLVIAPPTMPLRDAGNEGGWGGTDSQVHQTIALNVPGINSIFTNWTEVDRTFAIVNPEYRIIDHNGHELTYKLNMSYDKTFARDFSFVPEFQMGYFFGSGKSLLDDNTRTYTVSLAENTLNYKKVFGKHHVDILGGYTYQRNRSVTRTGHSEDLPKPYYPVLSNGRNQTSGGFELVSTLVSMFGRINYNFDDRYLLTATVRRDGSSRFAAGNQYGTFPSIALGWNVSNESFFPDTNGAISQLKLRGSYGELGNQNIGDYLFQPVINANIPYNFYQGSSVVSVVGAIQTSLKNSNIKWENTRSANFGLDASFFDRSLDLTVEYYEKKTTDVLVGVPIPLSSGSVDSAPVTNSGSLKNSGIDMELAYHYNSGEDFSFDISANASTLKNRVLSLGGNNEPVYGTGARTEVGREVGEHYGYVYDGIFRSQDEVSSHAFQSAATAAGDIRFKDLNEDGTINADDRTYLGSAIPSVTFGLNFSASYKNLDFTVFASGAADYYINSNLYRTLMWSTDNLNAHTDILNRWTPENTDTHIPRVIANDPNGNARDSNRPGWLQKGDYLRINTLSLGYTLPEGFSEIINSLRLYVTAQNVYTFSSYKGFNPDFNGDVWNPGFDWGTYPRPRTYMLGVQIKL
ncbi:SusC/RagA family TonB-linked outer membrane protein [Sinomicrobium soli]|uniref:SusC/RagA family TonB-linked outer membrane protein n=1 Tax=Sinomicrobium sp. N-1-3-6 TaxID=2219864 RepID=UPI000DCEC7D6|nr:TonB-dependent receptor [Sinomicrobium sp. N-1-3-6]RAV27483.1 TonB-dependent receptor [Sinomicrobium sp. N-1-3-6]